MASSCRLHPVCGRERNTTTMTKQNDMPDRLLLGRSHAGVVTTLCRCSFTNAHHIPRLFSQAPVHRCVLRRHQHLISSCQLAHDAEARQASPLNIVQVHESKHLTRSL